MRAPETHTAPGTALGEARAAPLPGGAFWRWRQVPWFVLACSLALTALGTWIAHDEVAKRDAESFARVVEDVQAEIRHRIDTHEALLRGTAGLFAATEPDRAAYAAHIARLRLPEFYRGMRGIGYAPRLDAGERERFASRQRATFPDFSLWPPSSGPQLYPVLYLEPMDDRNRAAIGFDMASDPERLAAIERARDQGRPAMTGPVPLAVDSGGRAGCVIYVPLFSGERLPAADERRERHLGCVFAPFRGDELLAGIPEAVGAAIDIEVYDGETVVAERLVHQSADDVDAHARPAFVEDRRMTVIDRTWTLRCESRPAMLADRGVVALIALGGGAASCLLFFTTWLQARARERAEITADRLRRTDERLRFIAAASGTLAASLDYERTLGEVAAEAVRGFADWAAVDLLLPDGRLQRVALAHRDPAKAAAVADLHRRWPPGPDEPPNSVVASGQPLLLERIDDERLLGMAQDREHLRLLRELSPRSALVVPLVSHARTLGAMAFVSADPARTYGPDDLAMVEDLARRAAMAIENSLLFRETDQLRTQAERASLQLSRHADELARSNAELEQFAYVASHDLLEPLRMITNYLDLLQRRHGERFTGQAAEWMGYVSGGAKRMQALIRDLLAFSRVTAADVAALEEIDSGAVLDEALQNMNGSFAESGATLERGDMPRLRFDRVQLLQVLQNLVANAVKFRGERAPIVRVGAERREHGWEFAIADNGIGMDPQHTERIFELFQRLHTKERYPGTGIGLAICRKIVERRGGRIWAESVLGQGTTFRFTVPD